MREKNGRFFFLKEQILGKINNNKPFNQNVFSFKNHSAFRRITKKRRYRKTEKGRKMKKSSVLVSEKIFHFNKNTLTDM